MKLMLWAVVLLTVLSVHTVQGYRTDDHRCRYMETKQENCTRTVYSPCPTNAETAMTTRSYNEDNEDSDEDDYDDDDDDFISQILRRFFQTRSSSIKWCRREETFTCTMYRCYIACCPNWKYDPATRKCSIWTGETPDLECQNGGSVVRDANGKPKCLCTRMFTGSRCEEAKCNPDCLNDGMCDVIGGVPRCVCSDDFTGQRCEHPVCKGGCSGRGVCEARDGEAKCACRPGFTGTNCEQRNAPPPEKPGDCPALSSGSCLSFCSEDGHCPGTQKCCSNGCGRVCSYTANYTCPYQGRNYRMGETFHPDACHVCTCLKPDPNKPFGGAHCRSPTCPPIENCQDIRKHPKKCCGYCADQVPDDYKAPKFLNCPKMLVTINVEEDKNEARLSFTLAAKDHRGKTLKVTMSRTMFKAGQNEENFDTVIATSSRDYRGNYAYCEFHIRIRDVHPPKFSYCPVDVHLRKEGPGNWKLPTAEDNVGLFVGPKSRHQPSDKFSKGEHPVMYTAEDYEGNIAYCKFFVKVADIDGDGGQFGEHTGGDGPVIDDEGKGVLHGNKKYFLIGGLLLALLIIVAVIVGCICCRRRPGRESAGSVTAPPAYDNAIYSVGCPVPPPYKMKPPVYCETVPEKDVNQYEELKTPVDAGNLDSPDGKDTAVLDTPDVSVKMGVDNPTYRM